MIRVLSIALLSFLLLMSIFSGAQPTPPSNPPPGPGEPVPLPGIALLFAAGAFFGSYKLLMKKLNKN